MPLQLVLQMAKPNPGRVAHSINTTQTSASTAIRRVLVVEDHDDTRTMLKKILEIEEFAVLEAVDGQEAYDAAVREHPDLILMDLTLPVMDGLTATREIRKHREIGKVPIIFLSGRAEPAGQNAAFAAGCDDFLVKPLDLDQVVRAIRKWLELPQPFRSEEQARG
jgi:CheY-like chemotaxis protein